MKQYFISGILAYLIFQFSFRFLSGLTNLALINFDFGKLSYIGLLVLSAVLTLILLMRLYRFMEKGKRNNASTIKLVGLLIVVFLLCSGINRYIGYLAENNRTINFDKLEYLAFPDFAFGLAAIVGVLILWFKKEHEVASS